MMMASMTAKIVARSPMSNWQAAGKPSVECVAWACRVAGVRCCRRDWPGWRGRHDGPPGRLALAYAASGESGSVSRALTLAETALGRASGDAPARLAHCGPAEMLAMASMSRHALGHLREASRCRSDQPYSNTDHRLPLSYARRAGPGCPLFEMIA